METGTLDLTYNREELVGEKKINNRTIGRKGP